MSPTQTQITLAERTWERDAHWRKLHLARHGVAVLRRTLAHLDSLIALGESPERLRGKLNVAQLEARDLAKLLSQDTCVADAPDIGADVKGGGAI